MTADEMYRIELFAIKKNQNGSLTPAKFDEINDAAQNQYVSFLCGNMEGYQPNHPLPKAEFGNNRTSRQRLTPSIYNYVLNISSIYGTSPYPSDYIQTDSMHSIYGFNPIRFVQQHKLTSVYNSTIDPIASNPIYLIQAKEFQFYPTSQWQAKLSYVRNPPAIHWGYTNDVNGRPVYDPLTSIDPIWDNVGCMEVIIRALRLVGVNLQLNVVMQYAEELKTQGN